MSMPGFHPAIGSFFRLHPSEALDVESEVTGRMP